LEATRRKAAPTASSPLFVFAGRTRHGGGNRYTRDIAPMSATVCRRRYFVMRRLCAGLLGTALVLAAVLLSRGPRPLTANPTDLPAASATLRVAQEQRNPWNHLKLNNDPSTFRFAIVTDNTGGARAGVFARAVEQLNWLQPEFVVSVGDYIEGKTEDLEQINREWKEFNGWIAKLQMPFFYVPGNHDISNKAMEQ
jgi:hypothetical protein